MPFEKGRSGNPGGRAAKTEAQTDFERKCREWASLFALDRLKKTADSDNAVASLAATREILDRGFGKPETVSYIEGNVTPMLGAGIADLKREIGDILSGREGARIAMDDQGQVDK